MAKTIKGITIEIDAETSGLGTALKDINKKTSTLQTELKKVENGLKFNPDNTVLLNQKQEILNDTIKETAKKLDAMKQAEKEVQGMFESGEIGEAQYRDFQREIVTTESKLDNYRDKLKKTEKSVEDVGDEHKTAQEKVADFADKADKAGTKLKDIGGSMSTHFTAPILAGFTAVTKGTEEFRNTLAKLETNAETSGVGVDTVSDAMLRLSGINSDVNENVEALSNLIDAGFTDTNMIDIIDGLAGAVIKFPDTLKIEGLADGLQETLATGEAVGSFGEMLERMGVPLDTFNEGLANAAANGSEADYILQTLADLGLTEVNDKFRETNEELVEANESTYNFQTAMAEMGEVLAPIMTEITGYITDAANAFNDLDTETQEALITFGGATAVIGPVLVVLGSMAGAIKKIHDFLVILPDGAGTALGGLGLFGLGVAGIMSATGTTFEDMKNSFNGSMDEISARTAEHKEYFVTMWSDLKRDTKAAWDELWAGFENPFAGTMDSISATMERHKGYWTEAWDIITGKIDSAKETISTALSNIQSFFDGLDFSLPEIKAPSLPTFTVTGEWDLSLADGDGISAPKVGVTWNAEGGIFTKPTIFNTANGLQGVGERGAEAIMPIEKLPELLGLDKQRIDYGLLASSIVNAITRSDLKVEMDRRPLGRLVGELI